MTKPQKKPHSPNFSSGPTTKRPKWSFEAIKNAPLGRSHRSSLVKKLIKEVIDRSKKILHLPEGYVLGIVPGSDTGAFEMAMWNLLGERGIDALGWESFGLGWLSTIKGELKLGDVRYMKAEYGQLPDLSKVDSNRDIIFTYNGTTSGVKVPNLDWIDKNRKGLSICDGTSAVFAFDIDWHKIDVMTYSWQKVLGGEAAHGVIILSPKAIKRLETYLPAWPIPKLFKLTKNGKLIESIFEGDTINTPSIMCIEDALDGLKWSEDLGGLSGLIKKSENNLKVIEDWVEKTPWVDFLAESKAVRSNTSVCLKIVDDWYAGLSKEEQEAKAKEITKILESEKVAFDINSYRDAPTGLRVWCGATVEAKDLEILTEWLDYAFFKLRERSK